MRAESKQALLEAKDITVRFGGLTAVDGVDFSVMPGEIVGLIGPNGAGKSTLVNALTAWVELSRGTLLWHGEALVRRMKGWRLWGSGMALVAWVAWVMWLAAGPEFLWQTAVVDTMSDAFGDVPIAAQLDPRCSVMVQVSVRRVLSIYLETWMAHLSYKAAIFGLFSGLFGLGLLLRRTKRDATLLAQYGLLRTFQNLRLFQSMSVAEHLAVAANRPQTSAINGEEKDNVQSDELLKRLDLNDVAEASASELSYGQMRRLEVARALAAQPKLLILDEPAAGLGLKETRIIERLLVELRQQGMAIVLIEHDMELVMKLCDRIVVLDHGQKIADAAPAVIRQDPAVIAAYLGSQAGELAAHAHHEVADG